jgi:AraC-like DNA-binding protein
MHEALQNGEDPSAVPDHLMQLVLLDLLAALFSPERTALPSMYNQRVFSRICRAIEARFVEPDLTPSAVASEFGLLMRYLQKLFSMRGTTCGHFISMLRLDHASRLLRRRALLKTGQPLDDIALACGFLDYAHFSRNFRQRLCHPPSAHPPGTRAQSGK